MFIAFYRALGLHTLKQRLRFWVSFVVILLSASIITGIYLAEAYYKQKETNQQLQGSISLQRLFIERWMAERSSQIRYLSASISGNAIALPQLERTLKTFVSTQDEFAAAVYVNPEGVTAADSSSPAGVNVADRDYYKAAREGREFTSDVLIGKTSGLPIVIFSAPVKDASGRFNGLVFGSVQLTTINRMMGTPQFGETGETYILDRKGRFLSKSPYPETYNSSEIFRQALAGKNTDATYTNYKGEVVYGQFQWTNDRRWVLVGEVSKKEVFAPVYQNMMLISGIAFSILLLSMSLIVALTKRIERPIRFLLVGTKIMRDGNYNYRIAKEEIDSAPVELQQLCDTFNVTAQKLKSTIEMLEQSAVVDQLTEVYNRRFIMTEGARMLETCIRAEQPCSVIMMDIDFFKTVNDRYGHLVGDRVIIHAASILVSCIRACDMVARYGGEEFLILAPNTAASPGGVQLAERIRLAFESRPYTEDEVEIRLTVSLGVADYRSNVDYGKTVLEDMISRADEALYRAKNGGRNRVEL